MRWTAWTGVIVLALWAAAPQAREDPAGTSLLEHPYVHKSPRTLGMGGADAAVGGHPGALFSNPAGLVAMRPGWHITPIAVQVGTTQRMHSFVSDLDERLDIDDADEQRDALTDLVTSYRGRNLHGQLSVLPQLSWRGDLDGDRRLAFSLSWLGSARLDTRTHQGFGEDGVISVDGRTLSGPIAGMALEQGDWRGGVAVKELRRHRLARRYSVRELVDISQSDDRDFSDDRVSGRDQSVDLGVQYRLSRQHFWRPRVAVSLNDLSGLDFGEAGEIPWTVDTGIAFHPPATGTAESVTLSVEYADVFHRIRYDDDHLKRTRLGIRWQLRERRFSELAFSAGLRQGEPTLGADARLWPVRVSVATYVEELGAFAGQDPERRYVLGMALEL